jgi:hypothetical protein
MRTPPPLRRTKAIAMSATAATLAMAGAVAAASPAAAAPGAARAKVHASYKVTGSTLIAKPNFTITLGPGTLASTLNPKNGDLTATLTLPNATASFKQDGVIPVTATTQFINDGPTTGKLNLNTGKVKTTSTITLRIVSLIVDGLPVPVGQSCETKDPVTVTVHSLVKFNILKGGNLGGTYTIGNFAHCGLATLLINATLPGSGNTITLTLGKAKLG